MPKPSTARSMTRMEWALLLILSVLWGGSFFFVGVAVKEVPPLTLVFLRVALAALLLLVVVRAFGQHMPRTREAWSAFFLMGLIANAIPFILLVWGQSHIESGLASILNATTPLFTIAVAHVFTTDEKMTGGRLAAVLLGVVGVAIMMGPDVLHDLGINVAAQIACLGAPFCYGFAAVFGRRFGRSGMSPLVAATGQVTAAALLLLPLTILYDKPWTLPVPGTAAIASILALAAFSTALAYIVYFRLLETAGATRLALVTLLIPITAIFLGWAVLGEALHPRHFAGMALIALGLLAVDGRLSFRRSAPPV